MAWPSKTWREEVDSVVRYPPWVYISRVFISHMATTLGVQDCAVPSLSQSGLLVCVCLFV